MIKGDNKERILKQVYICRAGSMLKNGKLYAYDFRALYSSVQGDSVLFCSTLKVIMITMTSSVLRKTSSNFEA